MIAAMPSLDRKHRAPAAALPPGATDCHMHVFGPFERYPLAAGRAYNVPEAPIALHERMKKNVGLERTVLVQASGCGTDNRALLAALEQLGARGRAVAVVDPGTKLNELKSLHAAGVRGVRLNLFTQRDYYAGDAAHWFAKFEELVARAGWHLQLFCDPNTLPGMETMLSRSKATLVLDHMGLPDAAAGIDQPVFQCVLRLLKAGHFWVKLAGADRVTRKIGRLRDAIPFMQALAAAAPERLIWGSDWPHIGFHARQETHSDEILPYRELDAGELLDVLIEAVPNAETRRAILSDNPARLYGF